MKHSLLISFLLLSYQISAQTIDDLSFGTNDTFEIMTWNLENFPKNNQSTIDYVSQILEALDVDFIALQEISNQTSFRELIDNLTNYNGYLQSTTYDGLAFIYKPEVVEINNIERIFEDSKYCSV